MKRLPILPTILIAYVILAVAYSIVTPIFEAPDENFHFAVIQYIAETGQLPVQDPAIKTPWYQEGSQPPLYYLLTAPIAALIPGATHNPYPLEPNPHAQIGIGLTAINHNAFIHTDAESFPWRGVALAVHLIRLLSIGLGALTIALIHRTARRIFLDSPTIPIVVTAFVAFNPMFIFIHASINNDTLVTTLAAAAMWLIMGWLTANLTPPPPLRNHSEGESRPHAMRIMWREVIGLSVILALAAITKLSGLTLYAVAGAVLSIMLISKRITLRRALLIGGVLTIGFMVIAGWWYVRNVQLYGDPTGLRAMISIIEPRQTPYTIETMLAEMQGLRISFWGLFGWLNVIAPDLYLTLMDVLTALATIGGAVGVIRLVREKAWERIVPVGVLGLLFIVIGISLINWTRLTPGTQGRLLFPALPAIAIFAAFGWAAIYPILARLAVIPMILIALGAPFLIIAPAYAPPPIVAALSDSAHAVDAHFGAIDVVAYRIDSVPISPSGSLLVTLYYRGAPDSRNLTLSLTVYDCALKVIGKIDSYPGGGNLPTSIWTAQALYADTYRIPIAAPLKMPCQPRIGLSWWDYATKEYLHEDTTGAPSITLHGGVILDPSAPTPAPATTQTARFSGAIDLLGYTLDKTSVAPGGSLTLTLTWRAHTAIREDFTVFVHLGKADQPAIGSGDSPPLSGDYPTSVWAIERAFDDPHTIVVKPDMPPGDYMLSVGLYRPADGSRLSVDGGGDSVVLNIPIMVR